jgi:simple sugar transport system permease protein
MSTNNLKGGSAVRKLLSRSETIVAVTIIIMVAMISFLNPAFFSIGTLFNILRSSIIMGIFAVSTMMVIIYGGVDVSFTFIAACSMYLTIRLLEAIGYTGSPVLLFVLTAIIGLGFGLINAFFISRFKLPTLIVTLGTGAAIQGFVVFFVGSEHIIDLPGHLLDFSRASLLTVQLPNGALVNLHPAIFITISLAIIIWFLMKKTIFGRGIYAIGGSREAAERSGLNIRGIEYALFGFVGLCSGLGGMLYACLNRQANPHLMVGSEMDVIAAVVLGGASITGGRGTVAGTLLGVLLIVILNNSLILIGIPSQWQKVVIGLVIIMGTAIPIMQSKLKQKHRSAKA